MLVGRRRTPLLSGGLGSVHNHKSHLASSNLTSAASPPTSFHLDRIRCQAIQFAVAANLCMQLFIRVSLLYNVCLPWTCRLVGECGKL